ncbi:cytochrome c family protein [Hellea sp.]|nr:cytochrome c family protein [Hellea sp.]
MDELGFNKIAGAVLATALGVMVLRTAPHIFIHSEMPNTPAYTVGPLEMATIDDAEPLPFPQLAWIEAMDSTRGIKVFKKCTSCHNIDVNGTHGTGPNLWNIVGSTAGVKDGFKYSNALLTSEKTWTYEELDGFLAKPTKYISGTNMNFIGLKKESDRAAVIELLRQASDSPLSQPTPKLIENEIPLVENTTSQDQSLETKDKGHVDEAH